ncbi:drug/metabolite transporter (DMT)-like permease [Streptomyces sp. V3I7]|nr:drug/metabolite transporter (DMT)-like permease [Streptomyces sp. V3I7]
MLAVVCAILGAASNALGTVFQRKAARSVPRGGGISLVMTLARIPAWRIGVLGVIGAAVFQALALVNGPLALVQPLFILELPFALLFYAPLLHHRLPREGWWAVGGVVVGLALILGAAAPSGGRNQAPMSHWVPVLVVCLGLMAAAVLAARSSHSSLFRAASLATAAAIGNALTAALMKSATGRLATDGFAAFLATWQTYGFAIVGVCSLLLLENSLQAGLLAASQPAMTITDATASLLIGVTLFGEHIRTGWFLLPEIAGGALLLWGVYRLTRAVPNVVSMVK